MKMLDLILSVLLKDVLMAMDFKWWFTELKTGCGCNQRQCEDNVPLLLYLQRLFFLMHSELTCTGTFNADVVEESLLATIIRVSFLSNPYVNDNGEDERMGRLYDSSSRSRFFFQLRMNSTQFPYARFQHVADLTNNGQMRAFGFAKAKRNLPSLHSRTELHLYTCKWI